MVTGTVGPDDEKGKLQPAEAIGTTGGEGRAEITSPETADEAREAEEAKIREGEVPAYMLPEPPPPAEKMKFIKWGLLHDLSKEELVARGYNDRSVDICGQELEKKGLYKRPPRPTSKKDKEQSLALTSGKQEKNLQVFAKGSPPEALIDSVSIPLDGAEAPIFEKGMKFGMTVLTLGVRVAQELTNMGVQQARPIIEMARDMRMGEAAAAKSAAGEAASLAAAEVQQNMAPYLMKIAEMGKAGGEADPIKAMMVRTMEPMIQRMVAQFMPGMAGQQTPTGWTRKKE
jgi:hypothetical protein